MNNFSNEEGRRARWDEAAYWGRRSFLLSGKAGNDFYHLINPLFNLRADSEVRVLLEEAERTAQYHARIQRLLAWLEVYEGRVDRAVKRADEAHRTCPDDRGGEVLPGRICVSARRTRSGAMGRAADGTLGIEPGMSAVSHRLKYAYVLRKRGEAEKAAALVAEADRVVRALLDQQPDTTELRVELAAVSAIRQDTMPHSGGSSARTTADTAIRVPRAQSILKQQMGSDPAHRVHRSHATRCERRVNARERVVCWS